MRELLLEIWTSISRNKLRTFLTGFSVAWGILMLVILLGSGNGLQNGIEANFGNYATNSMTLFGGYTSKPYMGYQKGRDIRFVNKDLEILARDFPEVDEVAANLWISGKIATYGSEFTNIWLRGSVPQIERMQGVNIVKGRFINEMDMRNNRKSLVIDEAMETLLFKGKDPIGAEIKLDSTIFSVVGVYKSDAQRNTSLCYTPLSTAQLIYEAGSPYIDNIMITINDIKTDADMKAFEQRLRKRLAAEHYFAPDDESAIWINNVMEEFKNFQVVFAGINIFVWIIGLGTLLAGIVGVSNIMLVTVTERTFEFGIRKALGAKPSSIIRLILTESVMITALFGYIGMVIGVAIMEGVNYIINSAPPAKSDGITPTIFLNPTLDLGIVMSATLVLVIAGLIAGYVPAYRAAQLKTIDAMRHNK